MKIKSQMRIVETDRIAEIGDYTSFKGLSQVQRLPWSYTQNKTLADSKRKAISISFWTKKDKDQGEDTLIGYDKEIGYVIVYLPSCDKSYIESIDISHIRDIIANKMDCYVLEKPYNGKLVVGIEHIQPVYSDEYMKKHTFVNDYISSGLKPDEIHDYIERWHKSATKLSIWEYLGFTQHEYAMFVENENSLISIVDFYKRKAKHQNI